MCGRLACGLQPEEICQCTMYHKSGFDAYKKPEWKNFFNSGKPYKPSYNICPSEPAPVLLSGNYLNSTDRVIAPMLFGLIPSWLKEGERTKYSTINCRIETIRTSKLYAEVLKKGQRCIVLCSGFYEWQRGSKNSKTPYFIHSEQPPGVVISNPDTWNLSNSDDNNHKLKLLKLAALFDRHSNSQDGNTTFSFTIITKEASSQMSWLHHRMPLIVENEEQCNAWLQSEQVNADDAFKLFFEKPAISWFSVSNAVNKVNIKNIDCIKPQIKEAEKEVKCNKKSSDFMKNWLEKGKDKKIPEKKKRTF